MGLFDSFSADNTSQFIKNIQSTDGALSDGSNMDGAAYYKVYIYASTENGENISIVADGPESFSFDTSVEYDTPYKNTAEEVISAAAEKFKLKSVGDMAIKAATASGTKLFTQALTAKVWSGGGVTRLSIPLIFQVEDDPEKDVLLPLMQLMYLSMPAEDKENGFLSGPGPRFDVKQALADSAGAVSKILSSTGSGDGNGIVDNLVKVAGVIKDSATSFIGDPVGTATKDANKLASAVSSAIKNSVKNQISVQIGTSFRLESAVITSVNQTHRMAPVGYGPGESSGINSQVKVEVTFESFYTLTQRDIKSLMTPMNTSYGAATDKLYQSLIGGNNAK